MRSSQKSHSCEAQGGQGMNNSRRRHSCEVQGRLVMKSSHMRHFHEVQGGQGTKISRRGHTCGGVTKGSEYDGASLCEAMMLCQWVSPTRPLGSKLYDVWECRTQVSVMIVPTNKTRQLFVMSCDRSCVTVARSGTTPNISGCRMREGGFGAKYQ